jgi:uncharacterized phage-associated protein
MAAPWFNVRKAAQVAAFFAREEGGQINVLKLSKLVYLADRKNMELHDVPISADVLVSMDHGPANSLTLDCMNGFASSRPGWEDFVTDRSHYRVGLTREVGDADLDELSRAELKTLHAVWAEFGKYNGFQLRDWTHENCPEWEDPHGTSVSIPYERVFKFLGKSNPDDLAARVIEDRKLRMSFATR